MNTNRFMNAVTLAIPVIATAGAALADSDGRYYGHMWYGGYGWGWMGPVMMLVFWVAVIVLVVLAVRWVTDRKDQEQAGSTALDILKERLARGEIDPAEYEKLRKTLEG
ncbi:MAG: SHOCT domain-containing protein [Paracoccaceae bacterium]|nr:SHOCT domain-containing protein [Paracoccaceae bacterium]